MDDMGEGCAHYQLGRRLLARLPSGRDIISSVAELAERQAIQMGRFVISGAVSRSTIGGFDPGQQVYVTAHESRAAEIVVCHGHVSPHDNQPFVHGHISLAHEDGHVIGGRLLSETILFAGEIDVQELLGDVLPRAYDSATGRLLWRF